MIYNSHQWNKLIQSLRDHNQNSIQEVMLPLNNIQQKNPIHIQNTTDQRLDISQEDGIPQNIQFNFVNKGFFNNYNSNLSFYIPIHITGLPQYDPDNNAFDFYFVDEDDKTTAYQGTNDVMKYNIVLYNNYICLQVHVFGVDDQEITPQDPNTEVGGTLTKRAEKDILIRLYKIPPTPQAYLDHVLLQKNNRSDNSFNSEYKDIYRKQLINNQLIEQSFSDFMQTQYAYVSHNQDISANAISTRQGYIFDTDQIPINDDKVQVLAQYTSTPDNVITDITYNYQVTIPLVYFHPFFQMAYNTPMELLNDQISMIFNFNMPIFTACYAYQKIEQGSPIFEDTIDVIFEGINDMKIILFKDAIMKYKTIEKSKDGIYYIVYRASDKAQYQAFSKYDNIVLQNVIPKLNSLDIIQLSLFDKKQYLLRLDGGGSPQMKQINNMDYYLGYSSLFNDQDYRRMYGQVKGIYAMEISTGKFMTIQNLYSQDMIGINSNIKFLVSSSDDQIPMVSFGQVQISIDDKNIIPPTYVTLEDIYKTNLSLYDIMDNKFAPNAHWDYPQYLKYFNTFVWKFDQKYGYKQRLQEPQFNGMMVTDAKSNIFTRLYNYNNNGQTPTPLKADDFSSSNPGFYNPKTTGDPWTIVLDGDSQKWIDTPVFCEFIYYFSALYMIAGGDLLNIQDEREIANLLKNVPFYNETDYKIAQAVPVLKQVMQDELKNEVVEQVQNQIMQANVQQPQVPVVQEVAQNAASPSTAAVENQTKPLTENAGTQTGDGTFRQRVQDL